MDSCGSTSPWEIFQAVCYQRVPPGYRFPYGHTHMKQEEVYWCCAGAGG